jgi:hypothetical protein
MENSSYIKDSEKYVKDLERYRTMIVYFERNIERVIGNRGNITDLHDSLRHIYFKNFSETSPIGVKSRGLIDRVEKVLEKNEDNYRKKLNAIEAHRAEEGNWLLGRVPANKSKNGTNTGTGVLL